MKCCQVHLNRLLRGQSLLLNVARYSRSLPSWSVLMKYLQEIILQTTCCKVSEMLTLCSGPSTVYSNVTSFANLSSNVEHVPRRRALVPSQ